MLENLLGFVLMVGVCLSGVGGYVMVSKIMNAVAGRGRGPARVHSLTHCPNCSADITRELKERAAKAYSGTTRYKCGCGSTSTWDCFGDPPTLVTFERVQQKKHEVRAG